MERTACLTACLVSALACVTVALSVLFLGSDHVAVLVRHYGPARGRVPSLTGHDKVVEAAAAACPVPPGPRSRMKKPWPSMQAAKVQELRAAQEAGALDLVFYGDSIAEKWREFGDVYKAHFAKYRSIVLAIPGDQSGNLLWRLQNGETPDSTHQPTAAVILIGTNDLNLAITSVRRGGLGVRDLRPCAVGIADRVAAIVRHLRAALPRTRLVLLAVTPRGVRTGLGSGRAPVPWPNNCTAAIDEVSAAMRRMAKWDRHVEFLDCGSAFLRPSNDTGTGTALAVDLLPDKLHPNAAGMDRLGQCLDPVLARLIPRPRGEGGDR